MLQSYEIWCDHCVKTNYYDDDNIFSDENFVNLNDMVLCKNCAAKIIANN